ncbi:B3 domain-containing protein At5g42700-like [Olea europaea var. sylvestris]|uniref:B3 domain-containing protein At5g42700-like n=1 Tax=Olea europaea var. sylvestris TaxID=158386 RepID=UPI000C1D4F6A|nr:B3 domain-containing protein At5g42700-like [Olea europaea var. sylvestris]XP_022896802.1 B3 domain-containing protein At5g42700-like [Olea europaea var. sylvestris]
MHASREKIMSEKSPNFSKILTELKEEEVEFEQREQKEEGEITGSDDEEFDYPSVFRFRPNRIVSSPAGEEREEGEIISSSEDEDYVYPSVFRVEPNRIDSSIAAFHLDFRSSKRTKKMEMMDNVDGNFQVNYSSVMKRSKEVQANLDPKFPSFFKLMLRFSQEFWLRIPSHFCKMHMPKHDETICLEDETGETYETSYFAVTMELSSGWRGFCIRHNLLKGDVVVFHLVAFCKFKVYIVRAST